MSSGRISSYSLFANQTRHDQAAGLLKLVGGSDGRPSAELQAALADFFANRNLPGVIAYARRAAPRRTSVDQREPPGDPDGERIR